MERTSRTATVTLAAAAVLLAACGEVAQLEELAPDRTCRRTLHVGPVGVPESVATALAAGDSAAGTAAGLRDGAAGEEGGAPEAASRRVEVEWRGPGEGGQRSRLNAWCAAVGPAVFGGWADPPAMRVDSIAVVAWNVHVGGGDLRRLVADLRAGRLTGGRPVRHYILLLQEAFREDDTVPRFDPAFPLGGGVVASPPSGPRTDIVATARELGLSVFYAPSMRNGEGRGDEAPEDRGNAILATLPLADPIAIELPVARQRRVAVGARVATGPPGDDDEAPSFHATSVHLENDASGWTRDERARLIQTEALVEALPEEEAAVAGGDFNTWTRGRDEALVEVMLRAFPDTPPFPPGHTYVRAYGLVRRYLDYLFLRLPDEGAASVRRIPDPYASDHYPIVGWIALPGG